MTDRAKKESQQGLDKVSLETIGRLKRVQSAQEAMIQANEEMKGLPGGKAVGMILKAAYDESQESFRLIQEKEKVRAKRAARTWARGVLDDPSTVILDTELTGGFLSQDIIEVAVMDRRGNTLFDSRVRPVCYVEYFEMEEQKDSTISAERRLSWRVALEGGYASKCDSILPDGRRVRKLRCVPLQIEEGSALWLHGIHQEDLKDAPSFPKVYPELVATLKGKKVIVYLPEYYRRMWAEAVERYRLDPSDVSSDTWECAMKAYAGYVGSYVYKRGHRENFQCDFDSQRLDDPYRALSGCRAILELLHTMAGRPAPDLPEMPPVNPLPLRALYPPPGWPPFEAGRGTQTLMDAAEEDFGDTASRAVFPSRGRYPLDSIDDDARAQ